MARMVAAGHRRLARVDWLVSTQNGICYVPDVPAEWLSGKDKEEDLPE